MQPHTFTLILSSAGLIIDIIGAWIISKNTYEPTREPTSATGWGAMTAGAKYLMVDRYIDKKEAKWKKDGWRIVIIGFLVQLVAVWCP